MMNQELKRSKKRSRSYRRLPTVKMSRPRKVNKRPQRQLVQTNQIQRPKTAQTQQRRKSKKKSAKVRTPRRSTKTLLSKHPTHLKTKSLPRRQGRPTRTHRSSRPSERGLRISHPYRTAPKARVTRQTARMPNKSLAPRRRKRRTKPTQRSGLHTYQLAKAFRATSRT